MNVFRLLVGVTLVALGVVFGGDAAGWWDAGEVIATWWPLIILAAAAALWAVQPTHVLQPLVIGAIGLLLLGGTTDVLPGDPGQWIAPVVLIGLGLLVMFGMSRRGAETGDTVNGVALFSGRDVTNHSRHFAGGSMTAIFGGATLDLSDATPAPEGAFVEVTAAFGGVDVIVPPGWKVTMTGLPVFGGFENKARRQGALPDNAPRLDVRAVVLFGGAEVKLAE
jgi:hypothetical protein